MSVHLRGIKPKISKDRDPLNKIPKAPVYFSEYAKAEWKRVLPFLIEREFICKSDLAQVETYCTMVGIIRQIETERANAGGQIDVKLFGVANRAALTARQIAATLGLDPTSRARLTHDDREEDDSDDPLAVR